MDSMEFCEKLQELRKRRGLTQEELAQALYVSRAAISKWESGRGWPSIDSLKAMAKFFGVTIDELLSGEELLSAAQDENRQRERYRCDLVFGLLDVSAVMFFFLPFFGQAAAGAVQAVTLLSITELSSWLKAVYGIAVIGMIITGIFLLALQNWQWSVWQRGKYILSCVINAVGALVFIVSSQPYAAALLFVFLLIKVLIRSKKQ